MWCCHQILCVVSVATKVKSNVVNMLLLFKSTETSSLNQIAPVLGKIFINFWGERGAGVSENCTWETLRHCRQKTTKVNKFEKWMKMH